VEEVDVVVGGGAGMVVEVLVVVVELVDTVGTGGVTSRAT